MFLSCCPIFKKMEMSGCLVAYKGKTILYAGRLQFLIFSFNLFAVQNLKMALKKANILQHTKSFFV